MNVHRIVWLPEIEEKLFDKHHVLVEEVEEALFDDDVHVRFAEKGHREGENLYAAYGQTAAGRWLIVFFILKEDGVALVISARDMESKERKLYGRR
jgi:uncharacterized DUF497 family protein